MKKTALAATVAIGVTTLTGVTLLPSASSAETPSKTMKFVLHEIATHPIGKDVFGGADVAKRGGKTIGYDTISGSYNAKAKTITVEVAWGLKGGLITAQVHTKNMTSYTGKITGGTGDYKGISGTVSAHSPNQNSPKTYVKLTYKL